MKRSVQISFILFFLALIYTVPIVQTAYEYRTNAGHRIQMLDLPRDLFVSPLERARGDVALIDSLLLTASELEREIRAAGTAARDTASAWDPSAASELLDGAAIRISILKKNAVDYNRHVTGAANSFAAQDTLRPYYRQLTLTGTCLEETAGMLQGGTPDSGALVAAGNRLRSELQTLRRMAGNYNYLTLTLTAFRRITVGANYLRPYETEMEKSSAFATAARPWMTALYYTAFGDLGNKGIKGKDGWLFYRPDVDYLTRPDVFDPRSKTVDANDVAMTEDIVGAIVDFRDQLASAGIDLLFVLMPAKPSIYPDLLNPSISPEKSGAISHSREVLDRVGAAGIETVDLFSAFARERENDAARGDSLYLRTDTHFKSRGVLTTARIVAERVRRYPWFTPGTTAYLVDTVTAVRSGDIAEMIGLPQSFLSQRKSLFAAETTACYQVHEVRPGSRGTASEKTLYRDDYRGADILVLGDSYSRMYQTDPPKSAGWISHLARELGGPVASLVNDGGASTLVRQSLARKPGLLKKKKLVIWEVVERDIRFGEEGWKKIEVVQR